MTALPGRKTDVLVRGERRYASALPYTDRAEKARYIADKYAAILTGSVLDVGCDAAPLRLLLPPGTRYVGADISPAAADVVIDLDHKGRKLPFGDRAFSTVVCTDVLEHLERCHAVFAELCRVADSRVIVSLPNPLRAHLLALFEGSDGRLKYYGLPADAPADRHRWFFGFEEALAFIESGAARCGFAVEQVDAEDEGMYYWRDGSGRDVLASPNIRLGTLWAVLSRRADTDGARG